MLLAFYPPRTFTDFTHSLKHIHIHEHAHTHIHTLSQTHTRAHAYAHTITNDFEMIRFW